MYCLMNAFFSLDFGDTSKGFFGSLLFSDFLCSVVSLFFSSFKRRASALCGKYSSNTGIIVV